MNRRRSGNESGPFLLLPPTQEGDSRRSIRPRYQNVPLDDNDNISGDPQPRSPSTTAFQYVSSDTRRGRPPLTTAAAETFQFSGYRDEIESYGRHHHHTSQRVTGDAGPTAVFVVVFILLFLIIGVVAYVVVDLRTVRSQCASHTGGLSAVKSYDIAPASAADLMPVRVSRISHGSDVTDENATYERRHWDFTTASILQNYVRYPPEGTSVPGLEMQQLVEYSVCCHTMSGHFTCCNGVGFAQGYGLDCDVYQDPESQEQYVTIFVESPELAKRPCTLSFTHLQPAPGKLLADRRDSG